MVVVAIHGRCCVAAAAAVSLVVGCCCHCCHFVGGGMHQGDGCGAVAAVVSMSGGAEPLLLFPFLAVIYSLVEYKIEYKKY